MCSRLTKTNETTNESKLDPIMVFSFSSISDKLWSWNEIDLF